MLSGELYPPGLPEEVLPPIPSVEADMDFDVAGESHYGLARFMEQVPADPEGWKTRYFLAIVRPDPANPYDSHAIKVGIVADYDPASGLVLAEQVGFIPRTRTGTWHKMIRQNDAAHITTWALANGIEENFGMKLEAREPQMRFLDAAVPVAWHP